ncbi:MAG: LacI family transcriptional regulator [Chloroflexi bacterium]|nr:MAG: LacI family transcriptional regulator [Chloroflexota bacterium]
MTVTLKDIAAVAGVSHSTVSRALNGNPMIPPETAVRIRKIADELGYVPNTIASGLRRTHSKVLGVLVRRIDDAFLAEVLQGIEDVLYAEGYGLFLATSRRKPEREQAIFRSMSERRVDGVIVCSTEVSQEHLHQLSKFGVPTVLINNQAAIEMAHSVTHDDMSGGLALTRHLIELGHSRIAYLGHSRTGRITRDRLAGYKEALNQAGLPYRAEYVAAGPNGSAEGGAMGMEKLLKVDVRPTAVVCFNDMMAIGAMHALRQAGFGVPEDCSVTGFDNIPLSQYVNPPLTTFHQPRYELGTEAAEMMLRLLSRKHKNLNAAETIALRGRLVVRESSGPPPDGTRNGQ